MQTLSYNTLSKIIVIIINYTYNLLLKKKKNPTISATPLLCFHVTYANLKTKWDFLRIGVGTNASFNSISKFY